MKWRRQASTTSSLKDKPTQALVPQSSLVLSLYSIIALQHTEL